MTAGFDPSQHPRQAAGRFTTKTNRAPSTGLTARQAAEQDYWSVAAADLELTEAERDLLLLHVEARAQAGEDLSLQPAAAVAADALTPEVTRRWQAYLTAERAIEESLPDGVLVAADELDGQPALSAILESDQGELSCLSDGRSSAYYLDGTRLASGSELPEQLQPTAQAFEEHLAEYAPVIALRAAYDTAQMRAMRLRLLGTA